MVSAAPQTRDSLRNAGSSRPALHLVSLPEIHEQLAPLFGETLSWTSWTQLDDVPRDAQSFLKLPVFQYDTPSYVWAFVPYGTAPPAAFPGPVVGDAVVSYIFYRDVAEVGRWWQSVKVAPRNLPDKALVLAMMKPFYLKWAGRVRAALETNRFSGGRLACHFPDETLNTELGEILSQGCTLAVYVGHGRSRGWSGYRGFRWKHVAPFQQRAPVGTMISLSCSSLAQDKEHSLPMGLQWIMDGRCGAFLGSHAAVKIQPLAKITTILLELLSKSEPLAAGDLVRQLDANIRATQNTEVLANWRSFRLVGDPFQRI